MHNVPAVESYNLRVAREHEGHSVPPLPFEGCSHTETGKTHSTAVYAIVL